MLQDLEIDFGRSPGDNPWQEGSLPRVETVAYDCIVILWSESYIGYVYPNGDATTPLRWTDDHGMPRWGDEPPTGWWCFLRVGSLPRPKSIKTLEESMSDCSRILLGQTA